MTSTYTVLHTNDFHNHVTTAQAARLASLRASLGDRGLLLDAGDAISSGNITFRPGGEPVLDLMSDIGYDAMTVGNREFHFSRIGFYAKVSRAKFPVLCANVRRFRNTEQAGSETNCPDVPVIEWSEFILDGGFRIAVFGVTVPMITERMAVRKVSAYVFDDPITVAAHLVSGIRSSFNPDLMVALTHIGIKYDRLLAERVEGIDLIIGGHTHVTLPEGERVGKTLIVQSGSHGRLFGTVQVTRGNDGGVSLSARVDEL